MCRCASGWMHQRTRVTGVPVDGCIRGPELPVDGCIRGPALPVCRCVGGWMYQRTSIHSAPASDLQVGVSIQSNQPLTYLGIKSSYKNRLLPTEREQQVTKKVGSRLPDKRTVLLQRERGSNTLLNSRVFLLRLD